VGVTRSGALEVKYQSTDPDSIRREVQRLRKMGLVEGVHFTVKMPEEGREGYVRILKEGLMRLAWLSVYGKDEQQRELAREFVELILQRAGEVGKDVYRKALEVVEEGKAWGSQKLERFEKKVEVNGKTYFVKVIGGGAEFDEGRGGRKLLRIKITAEVDGVLRDYTITYGRYGRDNVALGFATAKADDAERFAAVIKALTGEEPKMYRKKNGKIMIECGRKHLDGFMRYAELAETIMKWLEETSRR
jgi:23S rRNA pseudoU1915 N3-methylase RlmH